MSFAFFLYTLDIFKKNVYFETKASVIDHQAVHKLFALVLNRLTHISQGDGFGTMQATRNFSKDCVI